MCYDTEEKLEEKMEDRKIYNREEMIIGPKGLEKLWQSHVMVLGLGGVGGSAFEALLRSGIGEITVVDNDVVDETNLNRQALARLSSIGKKKTDVAQMMRDDISPRIQVHAVEAFVLPENLPELFERKPDFVIDCIDTVSTKIALAVFCEQAGIPLVSCMGTGNKMHPEMLKIADLYETRVCPLCRVMRRELKNRGVKHLRVCYSEEKPISTGERTPGSIAFVPPVAGLILAGEAVRYLLKERGKTYGDNESL